MIYQWRDGGSHVADAQDVGMELDIVAENHNLKIHAADVVEYAKDKKTALHDLFEWDDKKAGYEYRLTQARHIVRHVAVIVEVGKTEMGQPIEVSIRKYETIRESDHQNVYMDTLEVLADEDLKIEVLRKVRSKIESAANKMKDYNSIIDYFSEERQATLFGMVEGMKEEEKKLEKAIV